MEKDIKVIEKNRGTYEANYYRFFYFLPFLSSLAACGGSETDEIGTIGGASSFLSTQRISVSDLGSYLEVLTFVPDDLDNDSDIDFIVAHGSFPPGDMTAFSPFVLVNENGQLSRQAILGDAIGLIHPREILVSDFNNDGNKDFIIVGHGWDTSPFPGEKNALVYGDGFGGFVNRSDLLPDYLDFSHSVALGDLDYDGDIDIFVGNVYGYNQINSYVLLNNNGTSFTEVSLDPNQFGVTNPTNTYDSCIIVDIDSDGINELIVGETQGAGSFSKIFEYDASTMNMVLEQVLPDGLFGDICEVVDVKVGDIDGDNLLDIVSLQTPYYNGAGIQILIQNMDGSFEDKTDELLPSFDRTQNWFKFIELLDFDGDSDLDIVTTQIPSRGPTIYVNDGGVFRPKVSDFQMSNGMGYYEVGIDLETNDMYALGSWGGELILEQIPVL